MYSPITNSSIRGSRIASVSGGRSWCCHVYTMPLNRLVCRSCLVTVLLVAAIGNLPISTIAQAVRTYNVLLENYNTDGTFSGVNTDAPPDAGGHNAGASTRSSSGKRGTSWCSFLMVPATPYVFSHRECSAIWCTSARAFSAIAPPFSRRTSARALAPH